MISRANPLLVIAVGALGAIVGFALILANLPIGRALIIASAIGTALALTARGEGSPSHADSWFGRKRFGLGWTVRSWQGAVLVAVVIAAVFFLSLLLARS